MATTYNSRYTVNRYESSAYDGRSLVAVLAVMFLIVSLAAMAYLVDTAYKGYQHSHQPTTKVAATKYVKPTGSLDSPLFINRPLKQQR